jgi:hypothetical protein
MKKLLLILIVLCLTATGVAGTVKYQKYKNNQNYQITKPCVQFNPGWWEARLEMIGTEQGCKDFFAGFKEAIRIQYEWFTQGVVPPSSNYKFDREI